MCVWNSLNSYLVRKEDWEKGTWRETEKWKFEQNTVWKLLTRSTRFARFCTAQHSKSQPIFFKLFRIFIILFSKFQWNLNINFPKSCLKFMSVSENSPEIQHFLRKIPRSVRSFSNFLRFRNGNCQIVQKMIFQRLETKYNKLEQNVRVRTKSVPTWT